MNERNLFYMNLSGFAAAAIIFFLPLLPTINACSTAQSQALTPRGVYSSTFIAQIITPKYGSDTIKEELMQFNALASKQVVRFQGEDTDRPIIIQEHHFTKEENTAFANQGSQDKEEKKLLGLTFSDSMFCNIFLADDIYSDEVLMETVIHEYLHCFGYNHTPKEQRHDLMNAVQDLPVETENYRKYAKELEVLIYGK